MIYDGSAGQPIRSISLTVRDRLLAGFRCIYLNSEARIGEFRSSLAETGVDVEAEERNRCLILSSERPHLVDGHFEITEMLDNLRAELNSALRDGFTGLWATGDMTWEMGPDQDVMKLLKYEWELEKFFQSHPQIGGLCQYNRNTFPKALIEDVISLHPAAFINETLSILNAKFTPMESAFEVNDLPSFLRR